MSFIKLHQPCPECGSHDAVSINEDQSGWCFSCLTRIPDYYNTMEEPVIDFSKYKNNIVIDSNAAFNILSDRGISLETARKFGVKSLLDYNSNVIKHFYPYHNETEISGYKIREPDKSFTWQGNPQDSGLFGQQLFQSGGKYITLVEGECDAMAAYELLGSKWPVVSIKNGAGGAEKDAKSSLEFLEKFDTVVINFDNDKPGREAAKRVAMLLTPGKAKILTLPEGMKDPNDMLKSGSFNEYTSVWWASKVYTPSGIVNVSDMEEEYFNREKQESVPYPWGGLNDKLYGLRMGELVTLTGGTGLGKSSITRELEYWLIKNTKDNVGILALEEKKTHTVDALVSIEANTKLYIEQIREEYPQEKWREHYNTLFKGVAEDRLWIYSHLGQHDVEEIFSKLRYLIIGCDCKWIIVDHLHMLVSSLAIADERRAIDNIMTRLRSLVEETGCGMILVSHLRKIEGNRGHEDGAEVNISHMRGSQSIGQLSDCVLALTRNPRSIDPTIANTTKIDVLKSRYTGDVGLATHLLYNKDTGRLAEVPIEFTDLDEGVPF